jgi:hypothetical protein
MNFEKYQHVERYGNDEVENINMGLCYVFPKIDGTNGSVWCEENNIKCGSRNRELSIDNDNQRYMEYVVTGEKAPEFYNFFDKYPNLRLYGEWLIKHSLKTYRDDAWRKFYIFDVMEGERYLTYEEYQPLLEEYKLDYIPPIAKITNGTYEQFVKQLEKTNFLIKDGAGVGEGIVIKNYEYRNKYGRITWAKIVRSEFKELHAKVMGASEIDGAKIIEEEIMESFLTSALIEKTYEKIKKECDGWKSQYIPRLLNTIWHEFVIEEMWNVIKKHKNPKIDFKTMQYFCNRKIKEVKKELF